MLTVFFLFALAAANNEENWRILNTNSPTVDELWSKYLSEYGLHEQDNPSNTQMLTAAQATEDLLAYRKEIFTDTVDHISAHNEKFAAGESTYRLGLNQFADLTKSELAFYTSPTIGRPDDAAEIPASRLKEILEAPTGNSVDHRSDDLWIHNQGSCGSCWAFATSGMVENRIYQNSGDILEIANQEMVDCVDNCWGCQGGYSYYATEYIEDNGVAAEEDYAYVGKTQNCYADDYDRMLEPGDITAEYTTASGESDLASIVSSGAITVAIDVVYDFFYLSDGVFDPDSCSRWSADYVGAHAISALGYSASNGSKYWIIQNSWGTSWGDAGYGYMLKGSNVCNIGTWDNWSWISIGTNQGNNEQTPENQEAPLGASEPTTKDTGIGAATAVTIGVLAAATLLGAALYYTHTRRRRVYKEFDSEAQPNYGASSQTPTTEVQI